MSEEVRRLAREELEARIAYVKAQRIVADAMKAMVPLQDDLVSTKVTWLRLGMELAAAIDADPAGGR